MRNMDLVPKTVSARDLQTSYRKIFDFTKKTSKPIIVMKGNMPDVAIVSIKELERLYKKSVVKTTPPISQSEAMGMWKGRKDMKDAASWVREKRRRRVGRIYAQG